MKTNKPEPTVQGCIFSLLVTYTYLFVMMQDTVHVVVQLQHLKPSLH